jgi:hypothetical protein
MIAVKTYLKAKMLAIDYDDIGLSSIIVENAQYSRI